MVYGIPRQNLHKKSHTILSWCPISKWSETIFWVLINSKRNKFFVPKFFCSNECLVHKNVRSNKKKSPNKFCVLKIWVQISFLQKFWSKIFRTRSKKISKICRSKKIWLQKNFWKKKKVGQTKIEDPKNLGSNVAWTMDKY